MIRTLKKVIALSAVAGVFTPLTLAAQEKTTVPPASEA